MALQTGNTNGTATQNPDDISNAAVHMTLVDETDNMDKDRRPSLTSQDSLDNDNGKDNPAFEADLEASPEKPKNGTSAGDNRKDPSANGANKENVEMVPLNPAPQQNKKSNSAPANGSSGKNKDQTKVALDTMYSDYFRPVNTRRKLLRGEKLYVTRDQRAHSRSWKWFAFWGGVFTFIAAALLTGILAATGIIMSKSEPASFASSNSLMGNFSGNDTLFGNEFGNEEMNGTDASATEPHLDLSSHVDVQHIDHDQKTETEPAPVDFGTTEPTHLTVSDIGNALEENGWTSPHDHPTPDGVVPWMASENITTTTSTTPFHDSTASIDNMTSDVDVEQSTPERGRSLDEEATLFPVINETLVPAINETGNETLPLATNETLSIATNATDSHVINETISPVINETLFPATNETLFSAIDETLLSDINETVSANEHNVSNDGSETLPEDEFTNETGTEIQQGDHFDGTNGTSEFEHDNDTEHSTSLPEVSTIPTENEFILQLTGSGKPRSLFFPDNAENDTSTDEGRATEPLVTANVTTASPPTSTEEFLDTADEFFEEETSTLEENPIGRAENSTSELLMDEEFETTTETVDEELMNSTEFTAVTAEDTTIFEDEILDEFSTNSSEATLSEENPSSTEMPSSLLMDGEREGKVLVETVVPLNDTLVAANEANSTESIIAVQNNSTATNASELLVSPEESTESTVLAENSTTSS